MEKQSHCKRLKDDASPGNHLVLSPSLKHREGKKEIGPETERTLGTPSRCVFRGRESRGDPPEKGPPIGGRPLKADPTIRVSDHRIEALRPAASLPIRSIRDLTPLGAKMTCRTPIRLGIFAKRGERGNRVLVSLAALGISGPRNVPIVRPRGCGVVLVGLGARAGRGGRGRLDRRGRVGTLGLAPLAVGRVSLLVLLP